jgi:hypothetical protein
VDSQKITVQFPKEARDFFSPKHPDQFRGLFSILFNGYQGGLSPRVDKLGSKAGSGPLSSASVKNAYIYDTTLPYAYITHTGTTFTLLLLVLNIGGT